MEILDFINPKYKNPSDFSKQYIENKPYPHIVFDNFFNTNLLERVLNEFPDLSTIQNKLKHNSKNEIKLISVGMRDLSKSAFYLISMLNSDIFLNYLQDLTGIKEKLFSDPYLLGGGYHEIKKGGFLEVHADFNKYKTVDLDRRINLLIYLNHNWDENWNGNLQLYNKDNLEFPEIKITPQFNKCVIFSTTSFTFHGHPEKLICPENISRKSIALYYYSKGRPSNEIKNVHGTLFRNEKKTAKEIVKDFIPPVIFRLIKKLFNNY